jgi:hypothetical protein
MKVTSIMAAAVVGLGSGAALADISIDFEDFTASGSQFAQVGDTTVEGTLGSALGAFYLVNEGGNWTYASDLTVMFLDSDGNAVLQIGGWTTYAATKVSWPNGDSRDAGTWVDGSVDVNMDVSGYTMLLGNGYSSGTESSWTGNITLSGIDFTAIPAPGALALLGLAGFAGTRRRRG